MTIDYRIKWLVLVLRIHCGYFEAGTATYIVVMNVAFERVSVCLDVLWTCKNGVGCSVHHVELMLFSDCGFGSNSVPAEVMNDFCQMLCSVSVCSVSLLTVGK